MMITENMRNKFKKEEAGIPEGKQESSSIMLPRWRPGWLFPLGVRQCINNSLSDSPLEISRQTRKSFLSLTGQAVAEVAILGSLILVAFSVLLTYAQRLDSQLEIKMEAFRKALNRAYARNASVSYTLKKDKRFYNLMGNFGESQPTTLTASSMVMWQKGVSGCQHGDFECNNEKDQTAQSAFAYYEVNNQLLGQPDSEVARVGAGDTMIPRYNKISINIQGDDSKIKVPASVWKDETKRVTNFTTTARKEENKTGGGLPSTIDNKQTAILNENIYTKVYVRYDKNESDAGEAVHEPEYIYSGVPPEDSVPLWDPATTYPDGYARQGAWFNDAQGHNRVEYSPDVPENAETTRWRNWQTKF